MEKNVTIAWSGGFDSTAYLLKALKDEEIKRIHLLSLGINPTPLESCRAINPSIIPLSSVQAL